MTRLLTALVATLFAFQAFAGVDTETDENGVILAGHDAVAYFTQNQPVVGSAEFTTVHNGAIYRFSSAQNRDTFNQSPEKYAPAYGGFCSTGASFGKKFEIDGKAFKIVDGQLFVNKNEEVHQYWLKDVSGNIEKAETNWKDIRDVAAAEL